MPETRVTVDATPAAAAAAETMVLWPEPPPYDVEPPPEPPALPGWFADRRRPAK